MTKFRTLYFLAGAALVLFSCADDIVIMDRNPVDPCQGTSETFNVEICDGDSYTLPNGEVVSEADTYVITTANGDCDDTEIYVLTITDSFSIEVNAGICEGGEYELPDGQIVTESGNYIVTFQTASGCDSIITTNLAVQEATKIDNAVTICACSEYELPDGMVVTEEGEYTSILPGNLTCDTIVTTTLSFLATVMEEVTDVEICDNDQYQLPTLDLVTEQGYYVTEIIPADNGGCDSIVQYVNLRLNPAYEYNPIVIAPIGEPYALQDGTIVTTNETYEVNLTTADGCDLVYNNAVTFTGQGFYESNTRIDICDGDSYILPDGVEVTVAGVYSVALQSATGLDSTIITDLVVNPVYNETIDINAAECSSFELPDGRLVYESGMYTSELLTGSGCDSIIITNVTFQ